MNYTKLQLVISFFLINCLYTNAQQLNDYQYINIPAQFHFQKQQNQYDLNKLTQFLFNKYNFKSFIEGEAYPSDYSICNTLRTKLIKKSFLKTSIQIQLIDCKGKTIFISKEGTSTQKEFKKAYQEAIRNVFKDSQIVNHKYINQKPTTVTNTATAIQKKTTPIDTTKTQNKNTTKNSLTLVLRNKKYVFKPISEGYSIYASGTEIGKAVVIKASKKYKLIANTLSGIGYFDDFGNFTLTRINPINKKELTDTMVRIE